VVTSTPLDEPLLIYVNVYKIVCGYSTPLEEPLPINPVIPAQSPIDIYQRFCVGEHSHHTFGQSIAYGLKFKVWNPSFHTGRYSWALNSPKSFYQLYIIHAFIRHGELEKQVKENQELFLIWFR
jgi:hypothetical protein